MSALEGLSGTLASPLQQHTSLGRFTAARLGGTADWLYQAKTDPEELAAVALAAWQDNVPVRIIGGGANILISDAGLRGLTIINRIAVLQHHGVDIDGLHRLTVSGGYSLTVLARKLQSMALSGFEWAVSVPGTVGGAAVNNAGAHGVSMADAVVAITLLTPDGMHTVPASDLEYAYRHSVLKARSDRRFIVMDALLRFAEGDSETIQSHMDDFNAYRKRTQPPGASLGSVFKNPPGDHAGRLIEAAGLKGFRIGSAQVSTVHANFVTNDNATGSAEDYYALVQHVRQAVHAQSGIWLEPEIEFLGFEPTTPR
jgi:UDP-N-acetylmuramate dehydrogenase